MPRIENRSTKVRPCTCGKEHELTLIHGLLHYGEENTAGVTVGLVEHQGQKHVWVGLITGTWPGQSASDCYVTLHVWVSPDGMTMRVEDPDNSPLSGAELYEAHPLSREIVLSQPGAKEWAIETYQLLMKAEPQILLFLTGGRG